MVAWASSKALGCGYKNCLSNPSFLYGNAIVCNYGPAGNYNGQRPYEKEQHRQYPPEGQATTTTATPTSGAETTDNNTTNKGN
nr:unnamed protein product [Fasciola hepatica]